MLSKQDISENFRFINRVLTITFNNKSWDDLTIKCQKDLSLIENICIWFENDIENDYLIKDINELNNEVMKIYLRYFTLNNKLRTKALVKKDTKIDLTDENNIIRRYKGKQK